MTVIIVITTTSHFHVVKLGSFGDNDEIYAKDQRLSRISLEERAAALDEDLWYLIATLLEYFIAKYHTLLIDIGCANLVPRGIAKAINYSFRKRNLEHSHASSENSNEKVNQETRK